MRPLLNRISLLMPVLSLGIVIGLAAWAWSISSAKTSVALKSAAVYSAMVLFVEYRWRACPNQSVASHRLFVRKFYFAIALIILIGLSPRLLNESQTIDASWLVLSRRIAGLFFGAALALWGNFLPKLVSPWTLDKEPFDWQGVHRFVGWVFALTGIVVFIGFLTLPLHEANRLQILVCLTAAVLAVGRKFHSLATWREARRS